jgi:division protein CdvB (Snf7/Vps24/ESCRT-III family)|tara:strand:+ start:1029 stop:1400 length:372 start_codon:yes stop_codon:yes gene_type:complete
MEKLDNNINFLLSKHHEFNAKMTLNNSIRAPFNIDNIAEDEDGTTELAEQEKLDQMVNTIDNRSNSDTNDVINEQIESHLNIVLPKKKIKPKKKKSGVKDIAKLTHLYNKNQNVAKSPSQSSI